MRHWMINYFLTVIYYIEIYGFLKKRNLEIELQTDLGKTQKMERELKRLRLPNLPNIASMLVWKTFLGFLISLPIY